MNWQERIEKEYVPLQDKFYRVAFYLLESRQDALDAVQDLYVKLWNVGEGLESVQNPSSYGITLIRNICLDRIRSASRRRSVEVDEGLPSEEKESQESMEEKESLRRVVKAIESLPPREREVLKMRVMEEMSYRQMEERTGYSGISLRVALSSARKKLKKVI